MMIPFYTFHISLSPSHHLHLHSAALWESVGHSAAEEEVKAKEEEQIKRQILQYVSLFGRRLHELKTRGRIHILILMNTDSMAEAQQEEEMEEEEKERRRSSPSSSSSAASDGGE